MAGGEIAWCTRAEAWLPSGPHRRHRRKDRMHLNHDGSRLGDQVSGGRFNDALAALFFNSVDEFLQLVYRFLRPLLDQLFLSTVQLLVQPLAQGIANDQTLFET